jgi:hypothetical protein
MAVGRHVGSFRFVSNTLPTLWSLVIALMIL